MNLLNLDGWQRVCVMLNLRPDDFLTSNTYLAFSVGALQANTRYYHLITLTNFKHW